MKPRNAFVSSLLLVVTCFVASGCGGGTSSSVSPGNPIVSTSHALVAWNDLGMHCMDNDYSVFGILPPYNNLHAQLVDRATGRMVTSGVTLTYEATSDTRGSVNSTSAGKTNFWTYAQALFGVSLPVDMGLSGNAAPGATPAPLTYDNVSGYWKAEGIPVTPADDSGNPNFYPMVKVVARNAQGEMLASTKTVLPVSNEMTCIGCHASGGGADALPAGGWVFDNNAERDYRLNILRIHDEKNFADALHAAPYASALSAIGYNATGLENTVRVDGRQVLCAACHASNALGTAGAAGVKPLTAAIHSWHAHVIQDATGFPLDEAADRTACYVCHPGSITQCLRGAMGNARDAAGTPLIHCQSCHGNMSAVGASDRRGWRDLPDCGSCHRLSPATGKYAREYSVFDPAGGYRPGTGNFGSPGLYKAGAGHGGIQCQACHGATHAEFPSSEANDGVQSVLLQGYAGKIVECAVCHATVPVTGNGGPHGLHTVGRAWLSAHGPYASGDPAACTTCHGTDYRGTFLSAVSADRIFPLPEGGVASLRKGRLVGCYDCHNGPGGM